LNWKYHALDKFIKALAIISRKGLSIKLRVIGTGKLLNYYRTMAKEENVENLVEFLGYVPRKELPRLLGESDFAIVGRPSIENLWIRTSMRLTIYEYMACGLPIFAYGPPNSYTQYFINCNNIGVYVPSDEPIKLAEELENSLSMILSIDPTLIRKVSEKYDWRKVMQILTKVL